MLIRVLAALPCLLVAATCAAQQSGSIGSQSGWIEIRSPHFTVLSDASEHDARHVAGQFERMSAVFRILMPEASNNPAAGSPSNQGDPSAPITVLALRDAQSLRALEPESYLGQDQLRLAGLFVRSPTMNYVLLRVDDNNEHAYSTVYHEYTHYMLRKSAEWLPLWLNEGLAEFYQNTVLQDQDVRVGEAPPMEVLYLRHTPLLPLPVLLRVDHESPYYHDEQKGSIFYAESWALTHLIEIGDFEHKTHRLQVYANLLMQHEDPVTAAEKAFGDLTQLQDALAAYVRQTVFQEFRLRIPLTSSEISYAYHPVPHPQADAIRADVLLQVRRPRAAETLLTSVLATDPDNAFAHEVMGNIKLHDGDFAAARTCYGQAVELRSHSYLALYHYAVLTLQTGDHDHEAMIEASLRESIQLNPSFAPSYDALAHFYASRNTHLAEAQQLSATAVQLDPSTLAYRINAAQVLAEERQFLQAIAILKDARRIAQSSADRTQIDRRIADIERVQTAKPGPR